MRAAILDDSDSFKVYQDTLQIGSAYPMGPGAGDYAGVLVHNIEIEIGARNDTGDGAGRRSWNHG